MLVSRLSAATRLRAANRLRTPAARARAEFHSDHYLRHNARRQEHLASLRIPVGGKNVLEVGAGIGDHSHYFLDRGCDLTISEPRSENRAILRKRYPGVRVLDIDLDADPLIEMESFDVVYCYGVLYHVARPDLALQTLGRLTADTLLLSTAVSFGSDESINPVDEPRRSPTQATSGTGCRPTRRWIHSRLRRHFEFVYMPLTQPNHEEFALDWTSPGQHTASLARAIFVASRTPMENDLLTLNIPDRQERHP